MSALGARLMERRLERNMTVDDAARALGAGRSCARAIEHGRPVRLAGAIRRIATAYRLDREEVVALAEVDRRVPGTERPAIDADVIVAELPRQAGDGGPIASRDGGDSDPAHPDGGSRGGSRGGSHGRRQARRRRNRGRGRRRGRAAA